MGVGSKPDLRPLMLDSVVPARFISYNPLRVPYVRTPRMDLSMCSRRHTTLLIEGLESIDSVCKRRTRSLPSSELGTGGQPKPSALCCTSTPVSRLSEEYACLSYVCADPRASSLEKSCGGCMVFAQGQRGRRESSGRCTIPGPCTRGKAGCIRQCPPGPERCAHQRCESQRDGRHLASPPTFLVVCKPPGRSGRRSTRRCLTHRLPAGVADRFALSATGPAAFSRSLPINFRLRLLSFPLLVVRCAPFPWLRC